MNYRNKNIGNFGEEKACEYLLKKNFEILHQNYRVGHLEVDIIAYNPITNKLHFIEVKTRSSKAFGLPEESISAKKMDNLKRAAQNFLEHNPKYHQIQFDVFAITLSRNEVKEIFVIEDVFF
jgi:putative endonuclease